MAGLSLAELKKRNNLEIFLTKWKNNEKFSFLTGEQRPMPPYHEGMAQVLMLAVKGDAKAIHIVQYDKAFKQLCPISLLKKTSEFGGRGGGMGGAGVGNEKFLVDMLQELLTLAPLDVVFMSGKTTFKISNVVGVKSAGTDTAGAKKSDVNLFTSPNTFVPISLKQDDAAGWESSDRLFREAGTKLIQQLIAKQQVQVQYHHGSQGDVFLNRVVAMEATTSEQHTTVFGSDIATLHGAVITKTFQKQDITYNSEKHQIEIKVSYIYQTLQDIPEEKKPIWVIRNQMGRKSLPAFPGLRTEMKIKRYTMTNTAREGRMAPLVIALNDRRGYGVGDDILR